VGFCDGFGGQTLHDVEVVDPRRLAEATFRDLRQLLRTAGDDAGGQVLRLHYAEHWRVTIAAQLGVHPDVVRRVLGLGEARPEAEPRPRLVDPYRAFIAETLARYPRLRATRLHDMIAQRGYAGAVRTLREYVAEVRPKRREVASHRAAPRRAGADRLGVRRQDRRARRRAGALALCAGAVALAGAVG
jgi:hypothetical protein